MSVWRTVSINLFILACVTQMVIGQSRGAVPQIRRLFPKKSNFVVTNKTDACKNLTEVRLSEGRQFVLRSITTQEPSDAFYNDENVVKCRPERINRPIYSLTLRFAKGTMDWVDYLHFEFVDDTTNTPPVFSVPSLTFAVPRDLYEIGNVTTYLRDLAVTFNVTNGDSGNGGHIDVYTEGTSPESAVPFKVIRDNEMFFINLTGSLQDVPSPYIFLLAARAKETPEQVVHINVTVTLLERAVPQIRRLFPKKSHFVVTNKTDACKNLTEVRFSEGRQFVLRSITTQEPSDAFYNDENVIKCRPERINRPIYSLTLRFAKGTMDWVDYLHFEFVDDTTNTPPVFSVPSLTFAVPRDLYEIGNITTYLRDLGVTFNVTNGDSGNGGHIDVYTEGTSPESAVPFKVLRDNEMFFINLTGSLQDVSSPYIFLLAARDKETPEQAVYINVTVTLLERPEFLPPLKRDGIYMVDVNEDIPDSTSILTVGVRDNDTADSELTYRIINMLPVLPRRPRLFVLKGSVLYTAANIRPYFDIDRIAGSALMYLLNVSVDDGILTSTTTIVVNINDVNDNSPEFYNTTNLSRNIIETAPAGTVLLQVQARDADKTAPNNEVTYTLSGKGSTQFELHPISGHLRLAPSRTLGYKRQPLYSLIVTAKDGGRPVPKSTTIIVNVTVDTAPRFITPPHTRTMVLVPENITNKTSIYQLEASDEDGADKRTSISYNIVGVLPQSGNHLFEIREDILRVASNLKPDIFDIDSNETISSYLINISATDGTYTTRTALQLKLQDVNDNFPVFTEPEYTTVIPNTIEPGEAIIQINATDGDLTSPNNDVTYIITGQGSLHFTINARNGSVTLRSPSLSDANNMAIFHLTVTATDGGNPVNSANATLTITVETDDEEFILMAVLIPIILVLLLLAVIVVALLWYHKVVKGTTTGKFKRPHHCSNRKTKSTSSSDSKSRPLYGSSSHHTVLPWSTYSDLIGYPYDPDRPSWYHKDWVFLVPTSLFSNAETDVYKKPFRY